MIVADIVGTRSRSGDRRQIVGAARVRAVSLAGDRYTVSVLLGSRVRVGRIFEVARGALYSVDDRAESAAFGGEVRRFWGVSSWGAS